MSEELQAPRGTRDFMPSEALAREQAAEKIRKTFRLYGFSPLETPVMENYSVLSSKFAGGEEILKETYRFKDQGDRDLGLRYDLTVPLCRVFASNPSLARPFKRYQIAAVYRDGPLKKGRYREFVQCDVDTIGVAGMAAEAEILSLTSRVFKELNLNVIIKVNNRKLLDGLLEDAGVKKEDFNAVLLSIDKLEKIGPAKVIEELVSERKIAKATAEKILSLLTGQKTLASVKVKSEVGKEGLAELKELFKLASDIIIITFDCSLARGLNYYTGTVFEAYLREGEIKSSLAGGGRYDNLIGNFSGSKDKIPAVGISFGLDVIMEALKDAGSIKQASPTKAFIIPIGETLAECLKIAETLRSSGIACSVDLLGRGISKNLDYASKQAIPFAIFVGSQELKAKQLKLRNLATGEEELLAENKLAEKLS